VTRVSLFYQIIHQMAAPVSWTQ